MLKLFFQLLLVFCAINCHGQDTLKCIVCEKNLIKQADELGKLMIIKDYSSLADKMYPPLVNFLGGKDEIMKSLMYVDSVMKVKDITVDSIMIVKIIAF